MLYLASPFWNYKARVRRERFEQACRIAAVLMLRGEVVFSPVAHSYCVAKYGKLSASSHDFWMQQDLPILRLCDRLLVAKLPGWEMSKGVTVEIVTAHSENIPVGYLDCDTMTEDGAT